MSIATAIIALVISIPQAALAIWVMLPVNRNERRQQSQDSLVEDPHQIQTIFPIQRWRRCRTLEIVDIEMANWIDFNNNNGFNYIRPMQDNTSQATPTQQANLWDEPRISAAL